MLDKHYNALINKWLLVFMKHVFPRLLKPYRPLL